MKEEKRLLAEILKWIRMIVLVALTAGIFIFVTTKYKDSREPEITSSFINGKLEAVSELTASRLSYTGLIRYSEGKIPFLTRNSFSMMYSASLRAGIDLSGVQVQVLDDRVVIRLPDCQVQSVEIDTDSIEFYDEQWALFNWTEKTDIIDTVAEARKDVLEKADIDSLIENAKYQTKKLIEGLLSDMIGERKLVIQ